MHHPIPSGPAPPATKPRPSPVSRFKLPEQPGPFPGRKPCHLDLPGWLLLGMLSGLAGGAAAGLLGLRGAEGRVREESGREASGLVAGVAGSCRAPSGGILRRPVGMSHGIGQGGREGPAHESQVSGASCQSVPFATPPSRGNPFPAPPGSASWDLNVTGPPLADGALTVTCGAWTGL